MTEHTKEPWRVKMDYVVKGQTEAVDLYAHKKRIVACVNALAGIDDPALIARWNITIGPLLIEAADALAASAARISELEAQLTWRDISTAPKSGRMFLVRYPRMMNLVVRCRYNRVHGYYEDEFERDGLTRPVFFHKSEKYGDDVWMDIPPYLPPEPKSEG